VRLPRAGTGTDLAEDPDDTPANERATATHAVVEGEVQDDDEHTRTTADHSGRMTADTMKTAEINVERDRRDTLTSPISALIAESMSDVSEARGRDPAAPQPDEGELTRRVGDSDRQPTPRERGRRQVTPPANDPNAQRRLRAAHLIDQARALMESGALAGAVVAGEQALDEAERAVPPGIAEVIEPARPLLAKVFSTFVGDLGEVPFMARRVESISPLALDDRRRAVLALVDGRRSLAEILDAAHLHGADGLRIAASLIRAGILRVV
jgi:hypothetical protein